MYATRKNTKVGDIVLVPINGETWQEDEMICQKYEVVLALRSLTKPEEQIVGISNGVEQEPLPEWLPFTDEMAYKQ